MTLVMRGQNRSGPSIAGISLRELSVRGCVETDSGAKARLCLGTLCTVTKIGRAGISADLTATGANISASAACGTIFRPSARRGSQLQPM